MIIAAAKRFDVCTFGAALFSLFPFFFKVIDFFFIFLVFSLFLLSFSLFLASAMGGFQKKIKIAGVRMCYYWALSSSATF